MFQTELVSVFLQQLKHFPDGDDVLAVGTFYITPIHHGLASEIDPKLADRLFRKKGVDWVPCAEVPTIAFDIQPEAHSMSYATHKDITTGRGLIPHVEIGKLRAFKLFADDPNFTLAFDVKFRCDDKDLTWFMIHRMKKPMLVTFRALQGALKFPKPTPVCEVCGQPATHRTSPGKSLVCAEHVGAYIGEEVEPLDPDYEAKAAAATKETITKALEENKTTAKEDKPARKKKAAKPDVVAKKKAARPKK